MDKCEIFKTLSWALPKGSLPKECADCRGGDIGVCNLQRAIYEADKESQQRAQNGPAPLNEPIAK